MRVTIADRVGDNVLSDSTSSGTNVYTDGVDCISEITDKTKDPDVFSIQVGTPVNRQRFIRLQIPGVVEEDSCGYGTIRVYNAGDFFNMSVRRSRSADGVVGCYKRANKNDGWRVTDTSCIIIEHPAEGVWLFRSDAGCTAQVDKIVKKKATTVGSFEVLFRLDAVEIQ